MKLELKHLAPYLPYRVKIVPDNYRSIAGGYGYYHKELDIDALSNCNIEDLKPMLRPLSDIDDTLFEEIGFADQEDFKECIENGDILYNNMIKLFSRHFDVFGLIDQGLAVDINTL